MPLAPEPKKLKVNSSLSESLLSGQTNTYSIRLPQTDTWVTPEKSITVRLRRKGGDPLLMVRVGPEPPSVPRRSKIVADAWDQEAFDNERADHCVTVALPAGTETVCLGV